MKKKTSIFLTSLLILVGLVLALPFSPLRKSLGVTADNLTNKAIAGLGIGLNNLKNSTIAGNVSNSLQSNYTFEPNATVSNNKRDIKVSDIVASTNYNSSTRTNMNGQLQESRNLQYLQRNAETVSQPSISSVQLNSELASSSYNINRAARTSEKTKTNRFIAMSSGANVTEPSNSVRQLSGGAPPPSEGEVIGSLPIGDGYCFMLILAAMVAIFKTRKLAI
jgi:hypothetical protein